MIRFSTPADLEGVYLKLRIGYFSQGLVEKGKVDIKYPPIVTQNDIWSKFNFGVLGYEGTKSQSHGTKNDREVS